MTHGLNPRTIVAIMGGDVTGRNFSVLMPENTGTNPKQANLLKQ